MWPEKTKKYPYTILTRSQTHHPVSYPHSPDTLTGASPALLTLNVGSDIRIFSVKSIDTLSIALPNSETTTILSTVSSDGWIHVYDLSVIPSSSPPSKDQTDIQPIARYDTKGTRLTCVTLADGDAEAGEVVGKRKREEDEEEDEDKDEEGWESGVEEEAEEESDEEEEA